jgi:tRNA nucleotidyltransferase (CCA-adding enzyme)
MEVEDSSLEKQIIREIAPTPEESRRVLETSTALLEKVAATAKEMGIAVEPVLVGSVAKGTYLRDPDIDLFVMFPPGTTREELEKQGLALGMKILHGEKKYAEHPYVHGEFSGFEAEIVPCFRVADASQKMSAVDRTPFHTRFVADHLRPEHHDEVRLLKRFLKGIGAYGAEEAVRGFSGYLAEIVVIRFGGFHAAVEAAARWPEAVRLWIDGHGSDLRGRGEPMVFIDPVDPTRNVASALSTDKYTQFIHACQSYVDSPSRTFFFPNPPKALALPELKREAATRGTAALGIRLRTPEVIADIYYSQLRKFERGIRTLSEENGFHVLHAAFHPVGKDTLFLFEYEVFALPAVRSHRGPPAGNPREKEFTAKWHSSPDRRSALHIIDGVWAVDVKREFTDPASLIKGCIQSLSLGKHLNEEVKKGYRILSGPDLFTKEHALALTMFFDKRYPWEK